MSVVRVVLGTPSIRISVRQTDDRYHSDFLSPHVTERARDLLLRPFVGHRAQLDHATLALLFCGCPARSALPLSLANEGACVVGAPILRGFRAVKNLRNLHERLSIFLDRRKFSTRLCTGRRLYEPYFSPCLLAIVTSVAVVNCSHNCSSLHPSVMNCTYLASRLQSQRIFARIICVYLVCQTHIICERDQIICEAIAIIRPGSH